MGESHRNAKHLLYLGKSYNVGGFLLLLIALIIIMDRSTVASLLLQLVGHVLCTSGLQVAWKTFWKAFFDCFFWTSVGPSCVALPRPRQVGEEDCREDAADIGRNWIQNAPRKV